eukprot:14481429-Heterocapsa_arctica.AAC.1
MVEEEKDGARIFSDFYFMSTGEESMPCLAVKFSRSKRIAATALEQKGVTEYGVKFFGNSVRQTVVKRFVNHSNGEPPINALKGAVGRSVLGVE